MFKFGPFIPLFTFCSSLTYWSCLCYVVLSMYIRRLGFLFSCCISFLLVFNSGPSYLSENRRVLFGKEEVKKAKEFFFLCLNMLFISDILMIRSSAQVKSLSATLVVHRVYEPHLKEQVEVFSSHPNPLPIWY